MNNYFLEAEKKGRDKVLYLFSDNRFEQSEDMYACWDFSGVTSNPMKPKKNYFIETKDRSFGHSFYPTVMLEYEKLKSLINIASKNDEADVYYINTYTDNVALIFDLRKINLTEVKIETKNIQRTTMGNAEGVDKLIIQLPISKAVKRTIQ